MNKLPYNIKENSWQARLAAKRMHTDNIAMVLGKTIHLHGCTKEHFLKDTRWLKHELCHIKQFAEHGYLPFLAKYIWEWLKVGYYNNKYEIEAREAEKI